jgi:SAM-dependent methyltransferase
VEPVCVSTHSSTLGRSTAERPPELRCPVEHAPLERAPDASAYRCGRCGRIYPVEGGVVRFLSETDAFYEGRFVGGIRYLPRSERGPWSWPLWLIGSGYVWAIRHHVPERSTVLELGCASGIAYLSRRYRMIGMDLSVASLARLEGVYAASLQADVTQGVPLPDASVDAVISSFVWEHIRPADKPGVLAELARVLRPRGKLIFMYDVESGHPLYRRMQRIDPALFREVLIDREGHLGWEGAAANRAGFAAAGLRVLEHRGREKLLIGPAMYDKVREWPGALRRLAKLGVRFRFGIPFHFHNGAMRVLDETIGLLVPERWARIAITVCERP